MEREAREAGERDSNASKAIASRAARTARAGATRQRGAATREWRESRQNQNSKQRLSLMPSSAAARPAPGTWSWERFARLLPCQLASRRLRKWFQNAPRSLQNPSKIDPRRVQNRPPERPKDQLRRKTPLWSLFSSPRAALGALLARLGALLARLGTLLGRLDPQHGRSLGPLGAHVGIPGGHLGARKATPSENSENLENPCFFNGFQGF